MDVYQKTVKILEIYSESILSLSPVKNNPINIMLQEHLKQNTEENILKRQYKSMLWLSVLGLAGMELTFFRVVGMVLCFRLVTETMLITHQFFSCCWAVFAQPKGSLFLILPPRD